MVVVVQLPATKFAQWWSSFSMTTHLYFEMEGADPYTVAEFERTLAPFTSARNFRRASEVAGADVVVLMGTMSRGAALLARYPDRRVYCWDASDFPSGQWSGLYCSLPRPAHDRQRHASAPYPIVYNEQITAFCLDEAKHLVSFCGGMTAPVRRKVAEILSQSPADAVVRVQGGAWNAMYDRSGLPSKVDFAALMKSSKFIVCPRGNGVGSIRLFETLKAGRVPVIIADRYVLPSGIDWDSCSIRIKETDVHSIVAKCRETEPLWPAMAVAARRAHEQHFAGEGLANYIGQTLDDLRPSAIGLNRTMVLLRLERALKDARRKAQGLLSKRARRNSAA